jgi:hypothetical protein
MRHLTGVMAAFSLFAAPLALAEEQPARTEQPTTVAEPVKLTDSQLDEVSAGALVNVVAVDVVDAVVPVNVQANVLGRAIQNANQNAQNRNPVAVAGTLQ